VSSNPDVAPTDDIEAPSSGHQFRQLLTTKGFLALVISNTLGFSGEALRLAAQAWWILDEGGSNTAVGLSAGLRVIPVILISLYAGVMIDRFGGKRVLLYERWILVLLALATAFLLFWDGVEIWHIVVLSTVAGTTIAIGMPATNTLVAEIVPKDLRPQANILNQFGPSAGRTIGPLLAGILIAVWNAATAFVGLAVVYVISSLITMRIPARGTINNSAASAIQQIREGIRYIRRNSVVMWILILIGFSTIFWH
jgi:MFS family permease